MALHSTKPVPTAKEILDRVFAHAKRKKPKVKKTDTPLMKKRKQAREYMTKFTQGGQEQLRAIPRTFPSVDTLSEFYRKLFSLDFTLATYRSKLARIEKSALVLQKLRTTYRGKVENAATPHAVDSAQKQFTGRACSVIERLEKDLSWLEQARKKIGKYPVVKKAYTVCIAGFPNAGKTTLFAKITGSTPDIAGYAFTTKSLNIGYKKIGYLTTQFVDTPGTLNREHSNPIEQQAELALKYLADVILYVFDPMEEYPRDKQELLYKKMKKYGVPVLCYLSKQDIAPQEVIDSFTKDHDFVSQEEFVAYLKENIRKY